MIQARGICYQTKKLILIRNNLKLLIEILTNSSPPITESLFSFKKFPCRSTNLTKHLSQALLAPLVPTFTLPFVSHLKHCLLCARQPFRILYGHPMLICFRRSGDDKKERM